MIDSSRAQASKSAPLNFQSDEFMYQVAVLAWRDGLTTSGILKHFGLSRSDARHYMAVKRALKRAHAEHILELKPRPRLEEEQMQQALDAAFNYQQSRRITFHVVNDQQADTVRNPSLVNLRAAEVVEEIVTEQVAEAGDEAVAEESELTDDTAVPDCSNKIIICNAGGRSLSEMVTVLQRRPPLVHDSDDLDRKLRKHLLFAAVNNAYWQHRFERSANFLAVTMAQLYGAVHTAVPRVASAEFVARHREMILNASLFICGAGSTRGTEPGLTYGLLRELNLPIPEETVGDLAINFVDRYGDPVDLPEETKRFLDEINPTLNLGLLQEIAQNTEKRSLVILDAHDPADKVEIGGAILNRRLATDVVLGTRLAGKLLECRQPTGAPVLPDAPPRAQRKPVKTAQQAARRTAKNKKR